MIQNYFKKKSFFKLNSIFFLVFLILFACAKPENSDEIKTEKKKVYNPNIDQKAEEASKGFILGQRKNTIYEFSSANPIWRATLKVLEDIPLNTANYAGGIISTDWYTTGSSKESVKIQVVFYENKVAVSAFDVKTFKKNCVSNIDCKVSKGSESFNNKIKDSIINKTRELAILEEEQKKK